MAVSGSELWGLRTCYSLLWVWFKTSRLTYRRYVYDHGSRLAAAAMQASGGLDYMIKIAARILRKNPKYITFMAPAVTWTFTVLAGTGHVAYSVLPVIAEVSRHNGVRQNAHCLWL